jgi:hypothetical protein
MAEPIAINVGFPLGGINKSTGFYNQAPQTTPSCLNVWPYQWSSGRARGGVRPGLTSTGGGPSGTPYNWCPISWDGGYGVAVVTANGTYVSTNGSTWTQRISAPGATFATCAVYNNILYQASTASALVKTYNLKTGIAGTLSAADDAEGNPKGEAPKNCGLVCADAGRLIFAGSTEDPHLILMSRVDDARDWRYTDTDSGAAHSSAGDTGSINKPIIALLAHGNDCLLVGHVDGLSVIIGANRGGGEVIKTDQQIGPLMQSAWCKIASDHTVMMTRQGLYALPGGCARDLSLQLISDQLPNDLVGIDPGPASLDTCSLTYDGRYHGIHIYVDRGGSGTDAHYFFDLKNRAFFPMSFATGTLKLGCVLPGISSATKSGLIALQSGSAYQFDTASSESITSHCYYGPIALGSPLTEGIITELSATLAESASGTEAVYQASARVHVGQSPQEAFNSPSRTITLSPWTKKGFNFWQHPRGRGVAAYVEVYGSGSNRWCVEEIVGTAYQKAKRRRAL